MYQSMYRSTEPESENEPKASALFGSGSADAAAVSHYLSRLAGDGYAFASDQSRIRPLGGGYNNRLYEIEHASGIYVIKVYTADQAQRLDREYAALKRLSFLDSVPNVVTGDPRAPELSAPVLIYEKLPGSPVEPSSMTREDLDVLLETLFAVHGLSHPGDSPLARRAGPVRPVDCLGYIDETIHATALTAAMEDPSFRCAMEQLRDLRRCLAMMHLKPALWTDSQSSLCHGDCRPANVLRTGCGRIGLVDWEHAGIMDPFYEVAGFFWHPESAGLETSIRDGSMESYSEQSNDPHAFEKMAVYQTILPVQWAVRILSLIEGYDRQKVQPWNEPRPLEALWADLDRYLGLAAKQFAAVLPGQS